MYLNRNRIHFEQLREDCVSAFTVMAIEDLKRKTIPKKGHVNRTLKLDYFSTPKDFGHFSDKSIRLDWTLDRT